VPGLSTLLPREVMVVQWRADRPPEFAVDHTPYPGEEVAMVRAVPKRRQEFTIARACARRALQQLGLPPVPIPKGPAGEPQWPGAVVGSITQCAGYAAAAAARRSQLLTLGIDAEPNEPLPGGVLGLTASSSEIAHLDRLAATDPRVHWGRLAFCAKEALYKAWFPVRRCWLGFEDVDVRIEPDGWFHCRLLVPVPDAARFQECHGRWTLDDGRLLAAVLLTADQP
jgi:4'-phosphopantetheinyl transferase EntD